MGTELKQRLLAHIKQLHAQLPPAPLPPRQWHNLARPKQLPPPGDWFVWLILAGRGFGKTRTGAEWLLTGALTDPGSAAAVITPRYQDTKNVCFTAIIEACRAAGLTENVHYTYNRSDLILTFYNQSKIAGFSGEKPDNIRGQNLSRAWCDELAHIPPRNADPLWHECLIPALRIGERPRVLVTTTPRPIPATKTAVTRAPLLWQLASRKDDSVHIVTGSTYENKANLSAAALEELHKRYEGTRLGRQELYGEILQDAENALWTRELIDAATTDTVPTDRQTTITAVDPSGSATGDATGIVTATRTPDGVVWILADDTTTGTPGKRYETICMAAHRNKSSIILYEAAYGGDNIAHGITQTWQQLAQAGRVDKLCPRLIPSPTKKSKADRAHPVVGLFEQTANGQPRIRITDTLHALQDEMLLWEPGTSTWSPNRIDAMVHAVRYLAKRDMTTTITIAPTMADFPEVPI